VETITEDWEFPENLHYLLYKDGIFYIVHCLDFDIVTTADNWTRAEKRMAVCLEASLEHINMILATGGYPTMQCAPRSYWARFIQAMPIHTQTLKLKSGSMNILRRTEGYEIQPV
jgi:hypothetical protein